jgi:hypothetical protein
MMEENVYLLFSRKGNLIPMVRPGAAAAVLGGGAPPGRGEGAGPGLFDRYKPVT